MSKLGETTEKVLELLRERDRVTINELEREIPLTDTEILEFMSQGGLIEMNNGEISITRFGTEVITVG
ncbi:MAG: hypothetical protein OIN66_15870 [Candidatus Methanoperedens sp.]|nr:hypothetical protein [Candidatus Methanoperedens sp.]